MSDRQSHTLPYAPLALLQVLLLASLAGCAETASDGYPVFDDPELNLGRGIWLENCQVCHGTGLAGAPRIGDRAAWGPRIQQGLPILVDHALNGFAGPAGTEMPARGGNPQLDDMAVGLAVRYMVAAAQ